MADYLFDKNQRASSIKFSVSYEKDTTKDSEARQLIKAWPNQNHTEPKRTKTYLKPSNVCSLWWHAGYCRPLKLTLGCKKRLQTTALNCLDPDEIAKKSTQRKICHCTEDQVNLSLYDICSEWSHLTWGLVST